MAPTPSFRETTNSMKSMLPGVAVTVGVALLLGSAIWALIFPASRGWTDEKAARMTELSNRAHNLGFELAAAEKPSMHAGRGLAEVKAEADAVNAELASLRDELNGKLAAPNRAASILKWSGIAFVAAGAFVMLANRGA
jgi:hypothetical protein